MIARALFLLALGAVFGVTFGAARHSADQVQFERCVKNLERAIDLLEDPPMPAPATSPVLIPALEDEQDAEIV